MQNIKSFRLFESLGEVKLRQDIEDCLVELKDIGTYLYSINMDLADNYVAILICVDETDVPDEEYFHYTKTFDVSEIAEPILLLEDYMKDKFVNNLYFDYTVSNDDTSRNYIKFPTTDYVNSIKVLQGVDQDYIDEVELLESVEKLVIKYKW